MRVALREVITSSAFQHSFSFMQALDPLRLDLLDPVNGDAPVIPMSIPIEAPRRGIEDSTLNEYKSAAIVKNSTLGSNFCAQETPSPDGDIALTQTSNTLSKTLLTDDGTEPPAEDLEGHSNASDSEDNEDVGSKPHGVTERRRVQNAKFKSWLVAFDILGVINTITEAIT